MKTCQRTQRDKRIIDFEAGQGRVSSAFLDQRRHSTRMGSSGNKLMAVMGAAQCNKQSLGRNLAGVYADTADRKRFAGKQRASGADDLFRAENAMVGRNRRCHLAAP